MTTVVGASSTSYPATEWPHQRRLAVVGDRLVAIYSPDGLSAKVKWSTTSTSAWTDYAANIPGWSEGSFACFQDAGGTWRAVTIWVQSENTPDRTVGFVYMMAGTFSADLTSFSWGSITAMENPATFIVGGGAGGTLSAPDLDVVPDGSGGVGFAAWGALGTAGSWLRYRRFTVSSAGVLTFNAANTSIGPWSGLSTFPFPSVAIDPVSKHAGLFYSTGQTSGQAGPNFGSRWRRFTYAGGDYTPGPERLVDSDPLIPTGNPSEAFTAACRWDPSRNVWVWGGYLASGGILRVGVYQRDLADTVTDRIFYDASPTLLGSGSLAVDPATGNVHLFGSHHTLLGSPASLKMRVLSRPSGGSQLVDGGLTTIDTSTDISGISSLAAPGAMHLLFGQGTTFSWTVSYLKQALQLAPNAPVLLTPTGGLEVNVAEAQRFSWGNSFPTPGDSQSAYRRSIKAAADPSFTTSAWIPSTAARVDVAAGTYTAGITYEWYIEVKGSTGLVSPPSASGFFVGVGASADLSITAPANAATVPARYDVTWSTTLQDSFQVRVVDPSASTVYFDTGEIVSADRATTAVLDTTVVATGSAVLTQVRVKTSGVWSDWESVTGVASFASPGLVVTTLEYVDTDLAVTVDRAVAIGLKVQVTNYIGDPDPIVPPADDDDDLHVDAGSSTGGSY